MLTNYCVLFSIAVIIGPKLLLPHKRYHNLVNIHVMCASMEQVKQGKQLGL